MACRNDFVADEVGLFPRSCPDCGFGPCRNLNNKEKHLAYNGDIPIWEHETPHSKEDRVFREKVQSALSRIQKAEMELTAAYAALRELKT